MSDAWPDARLDAGPELPLSAEDIDEDLEPWPDASALAQVGRLTALNNRPDDRPKEPLSVWPETLPDAGPELPPEAERATRAGGTWPSEPSAPHLPDVDDVPAPIALEDAEDAVDIGVELC